MLRFNVSNKILQGPVHRVARGSCVSKGQFWYMCWDLVSINTFWIGTLVLSRGRTTLMLKTPPPALGMVSSIMKSRVLVLLCSFSLKIHVCLTSTANHLSLEYLWLLSHTDAQNLLGPTPYMGLRPVSLSCVLSGECLAISASVFDHIFNFKESAVTELLFFFCQLKEFLLACSQGLVVLLGGENQIRFHICVSKSI